MLIDKDMVEAATDIIGKAWLADHLSPVAALGRTDIGRQSCLPYLLWSA
jgi:hypothetical protein